METKLFLKKGQQFWVLDGSKVNAGGTWEFYDAETTNPQNVFSDSEGVNSLGSIVTLDSNGRLTTSIYQGTTPLKYIHKQNNSVIIVSDDNIPGAEEEVVFDSYTKSISVVSTLTGTENTLTADQAGETFILNKVGGDVEVVLPNALTVDSGKGYSFKVSGDEFVATITGATEVDFDGAPSIVIPDDDASFELKSNGITYEYFGLYQSLYDVTEEKVRIRPVAPRLLLPRDWINKNTLSVNALDPINDLNIAPGECQDDTYRYDFIVEDTFTKKFDEEWEIGTDVGMLDTVGGNILPDTWYHIFRIANPITGETDILASLSRDNPALPLFWTLKRYIGSVYMDTVPQIRPFRQTDDRFIWALPIEDHFDTNTTDAEYRIAFLSVPKNVSVLVLINLYMSNNGVFIWSPLGTDIVAEPSASTTGFSYHSAVAGGGQVEVFTGLDRDVRYWCDADGNGIYFNTYGYINTRGRDL